MAVQDLFGYQGKTVVIDGCATGMGQAAVAALLKLGAAVYALDIKEVTAPVKKFIKVDMGDKLSIEAAAKQLPDQIDSFFNCAALPGPPWSPLQITTVNFIGFRHLAELLIPRIKPGGAIAVISSQGGFGYRKRLGPIKELLKITDFEKSKAWLEAHAAVNDGYVFSKECIIVYTKWKASQLAPKNVRINCISPSPTDTPMMTEFVKFVPKNVMDNIRGFIGRNATPEEMAEPLIFLNSHMARYVSGQNLCVDYGWQGAYDIGSA